MRLATIQTWAGPRAAVLAGDHLVDVHATDAQVPPTVREILDLGPAALAFRTLDSFPLRWFFDDLFSRFGGYPLSIFGAGARVALMWIVPVGFVAWLPASALLGKADELPFPGWLAWCSPLLGVALMATATWLFVCESRHYQSSGS